MLCPTCGHHEQPQRVTCPRCAAAFDARQLEALERVEYLCLRVAGWRSAGILPAGTAQRLLDEAARERDGLQRALGIGIRGGERAEVLAPAAARVAGAPEAQAAVSPLQVAGTPAAAPAGVVPPAPVAPRVPRAPEMPPPPAADGREATSRLAGRGVGGGATSRLDGRGFSWSDLGRSLLSERTLHALLGLGAFLILTSGAVISVLNPTGLGPLLHLVAVLATALLFCGAGWVVRQRLGLALTGTALLGIGAAFVPLAIWTLGQRRLLDWPPSTVWLVASAVCLPLYGGAYAYLRDRAFATLTALAGASLVLALTYWAGVPLEWGLCAVLLLGMAYLELARRTAGRLGRGDEPAGRAAGRWPELSEALFFTAQVATALILVGLLAARFVSLAAPARLGAGVDEYAVGAAWWLGVAFYALASRLAVGRAAQRGFAFGAAWTLPVAFLLTLTRAPWERAWYGLCLCALAALYLLYGRWIRALPGRRPDLGAVLGAWPYQVGLALALAASLWPPAEPATREVTLWVVAAVAVLAAVQTGHIALHYGGAYLVAGAALLTLQRLQGQGLYWAAPPWYGVWAGLLALGFLLVGRCAGRPWPPADRRAWRPSPESLLRSPVFQVAFLLTLSPLLSPGTPAGGPAGQAPAILAMCGVYAGATVLLRRGELAYVSVALLVLAYGALLSLAGVPSVAFSLLWAALAAVLLLTGFSILGAFGAPLYIAGHVALLLALGWGLARLYPAPVGGAGLASAPAAAGLLAVVALYAGAAVRRRSTALLCPACWLFPLPATALAGLLFAQLGWPMTEAHLGRILGALAVGYLALAFALDRSAWPYGKPMYLTAYALLPLAVLYSALDRAALVQVLGLAVGALGWSALLVDRGGHRTYLWLTERLFRDAWAPALPAARALFLYLACGLFPAWLLLAMTLLQTSAPAVAVYGLALTLLAPLYVGLGRWCGRRRAEYRPPWYLSGYALSGVGPLVALGDPLLGVVTLAVSVALYAVSAAVSRRSVWVTLVALLLPVLLWQTLDGLAAFERYYGLGLVLLGLLYVVAGAGLQGLAQGPAGLSPRRLALPIRGPIRGDVSPLAVPFFVTAYAFSALGLARVANQDQGLVVAGFLAGATLYGGSARLFRQRLFAYPVAACLSVAYVVGATLTPLDPGRVGLGLLPGVVALLAGAEAMRRKLDVPAWAAWESPAGGRGSIWRWLDSWSGPFYGAAYLGALALPALPSTPGTWAVSWWSLAAVCLVSAALFRHPAWLHPGLALSLVAWLATVAAVAPDLSTAGRAATLMGPTAALLLLGCVGDRRLLRLAPSWASPLLRWGWVALAVSVLGSWASAPDALRVAGVYAALLAGLSLVWRRPGEVWGALGLTALACAAAFRAYGVPLGEQLSLWAALGLGLGLLAIALRRRPLPALAPWPHPLFLASTGAGAGALLGALVWGLLLSAEGGLGPVALTSTLAGLTVLAHGADRRQRLLAYLGVALLLLGYVSQLVALEVQQAQAYSVPLGLYLLTLAYCERRWGSRGAAPLGPALEMGGLALLLGVPLLQALGFIRNGVDSYAYATALLGQSVALFGLGAVLHWRRTFFAGATVLVVDVGILLVDPLRAVNTWYLVAVTGLAMIALVVFVERQRQRIPTWVGEWRQRLEVWD